MMKRILLSLGLLFCSTNIFGTVLVGTLDTVADGGNGFGDTVDSAQVGYVVTTTLSTITINASAVQSDGKIVVVGSNVTDPCFARYMIDGTLDIGIITIDLTGASSGASATGVALQADGKIVIIGTCTVSGVASFFIARYLPNGSLDTSSANGNVPFNGSQGYVIKNIGQIINPAYTATSSSDTASAVLIDDSGNILVTGTTAIIQQGTFPAPRETSTCIYVVRYTSAGTFDTSFNSNHVVSGGNGAALFTTFGVGLISISTDNYLAGNGMAFDAQGNLLLVGSSTVTSVSSIFMARMFNNSSDGAIGTLDGTFNSSGYEIVATGSNSVGYSIAAQSSGDIVVSASAGNYQYVARFTNLGSFISPFQANTFGGTSIPSGMVIQDDDAVVISGTVTISGVNNFFIVRYLSDISAIDTTFCSPNGYNVTSIAAPSNAASLAMQQNGSFIVAGSAGTAPSNFAVARYLGNSGVQGCINDSYEYTNSPGFKTYPTDITPTDLPVVVSTQALPNNQLIVLSNNNASPYNSHLSLLNADGTVAASFAGSLPSGAQSVIIDSFGRPVIVGGNTDLGGWLARCIISGSSIILDPEFNSGAIVNDSYVSYFNRVGQQTSGNYIVFANNAISETYTYGYGNILEYGISGNLITEIFGTAGNFYDLLINNSNNIWMSYIVASSIYLLNNIASESGFNLVSTSLSSTYYDGFPCIAFDTDQNVILGISRSGTGELAFRKYNSSSQISSLDIAQSQNLLTSPFITMIQCDTDNRIVFAGYDSNVFFVGRILADFSGLDINFAPYSSTPGIAKITYNTENPSDGTIPARVLNSIGISPSGSIQFGGYENIDATHSVSLVGQMVGQLDVTENARFPQGPLLPMAGRLDTGFNSTGVNPGFMNLHTELNTLSAYDFIVPAIAQVVLQNADGSYFIAANGADGYITKMTNQDVQDTTFASGTHNILTIASTPIQAMMIDQAGYLVVLGNGGQLQQFNATTGAAISSFNVTVHLNSSSAIAQQSDGRYIVVGLQEGSSDFGTVIAYNCVTGAVDTTFGTNGIFHAGYTRINSMVIDTTDDIYFISNDVGTSFPILQSLNASGTLFSDAGTTSIASIGSCNFIAFNPSRNLIVATVAEHTPYTLTIQSFTTTLRSVTTLSLPIGTTGLTAPIIESMIVDADGNIVITGCNNSGTPVTPFVMRVLADLSGLDTSFTSGSGTPGVVTANAVGSGAAEWRDAFIQADGNITVSGYETVSSATTPYLMRLYGTTNIGQYDPSITAGTPGTINTNFGSDGLVQLIAGEFAGATALAITVLPDGFYYVAFDNGHIARFTNGNILDVSYNPTGAYYPAGFAQILTPQGLSSMIIDGDGHLMCAGTDTVHHVAWVQRFTANNSGAIDPTFNGGNGITIGNAVFVQIVQQTLDRYIIAGQDNTSGDATLWAYTNTGVVDTTFNSNLTPGYYATAISHQVSAVIADVYDRLIFAHYDGTGASATIAITRLTASGEIDTTFGVGGTIVNAIANATNAIQIRLAFDASGNIVAAANVTISGVQKIAVCAYANGTGTTIAEVELDITGLNTPTLTNLIVTADGKVLVAGYQAANDDMWIARVKDNGSGTYELDTTFAPSPETIPGILQFNFDPGLHVVSRNLSSIAIYGDGEIIMVGAEIDNDPTPLTVLSFVTMAYDTPYTTQELSCQNSKPIGSNDLTLGVQSPPANGILFYATTNTDPLDYQYAQAIALQNDERILVAIQGQVTEEGSSQIFLNAFDVDGLLDTTFNSDAVSPLAPGQALVVSMFDNQYVSDMMTFATTDGVHKAIVAGYAASTALGSNNSLLMQYNLDTAVLDNSFGGYNGDLPGLAVGTGSSQAFVVGRQSMGRIILSGYNPGNTVGLIQGYTTAGLLDQSFGAGGYFTQGSTGIYVSVVDALDRLLIAYNDGSNNLVLARILADGSGLDQTFGTDGTHPINYGGLVTSNNSFRMVLDQSGNIFLAVVLSGGTQIAVNQFDPNGQDIVESTTFTSANFGGSLINFTIGKLLLNNQGALGIIGSDASSILIAQVIINESEALALDSSFNTADTPGYLRYNISTEQQTITNALIHPDGRYILVGYTQSEPV